MNDVNTPQKKAPTRRFSLGLLSEYRMQLMGVCAIGVILCHANLSVSDVQLPLLIRYFFGLGNQGVDIFFLLSGLGMYYSLQRQEPLRTWYLKRFCAVCISYVLLATPFYIWFVADRGGTVLDFFAHLSFVGFWVEDFGAWYLAVLIPLYAVTPFVGRWIDSSRRREITAAAVILGVFSVCLIGKGFSEGVLNNVFSRFLHSPTYFLGYALGKEVKEKKSVSWWLFPIFTVLFFALTLLPDRFGFAYKVLYVPIVMLLCVIVKLVYTHIKWLNVVFCWCGVRSLELYLTNIFLPFVLRAVPVWDAPWNTGNYAFYAVVIALGVLISQLIYTVRSMIQTRLLGRK